MVQNPKGGGLSSSFGGGGQQMGGVQKTTDFLDRSTWILATLLLLLILLSNFGLDTNPSLPNDSKLIEDTETEIIPETLPEEVFEDTENPNTQN
jgi:preprotein translocase subunit SecG